MKFELIKESGLAKGMRVSNLIDVLEKLGWEECFFE
jgi:predicted RNA binding protein YcfA (HicA-like mRNA interferase family)